MPYIQQFQTDKKYVFDGGQFIKARNGHDKEGDRKFAKKYDGAPVVAECRFYGYVMSRRGKRPIKVVPKWCREEA